MKRQIAILALGLAPAALSAQVHEHGTVSGRSLGLGVSALGVLTHATPAEHGRNLTEGYLSQPMLMLFARAGRLSGLTTANLEGLTLERGELNAGTWGEGYVDRRHPHTYLHEAVLSFDGSGERLGWSLTAGKGFVPFGTDDPMSRPFIKFPANHHLAQVLERLLVIGAARYGPFILEGGSFNGDEPAGVDSFGTIDRVGDSWAARFTLRPRPGFELAASHAYLESPENPVGNTLDQRKWSVALRYQQTSPGNDRYFLIEWARTGDLNDGAEILALHSWLAEGSLRRNAWQGGLRLERTLRPEEERAGSIFRSPWPHGDERIWGLTRWLIATANLSYALELGPVRLAPVFELSHQRPEPTVEPAIFTPEQLYGSNRLWSFSLGLRVGAGLNHGRVGRYGVAR